jgi:hypothetical protein
MPKTPPSSKDALLAGTAILDPILTPHGFAFEFRAEGDIAGESFAWGEYVQGERSLELHYRDSLNAVNYFGAGGKASHETYMRELGFWGHHRYPGGSAESLGAFHDLAHDLRHALDFLSGDAQILAAAAEKEAHHAARELRKLKALYMGDGDRVDAIEAHFQARRYPELLEVFAQLKFPDLLEEPHLGMVNEARQRIGH